jgi:hypothetical protein
MSRADLRQHNQSIESSLTHLPKIRHIQRREGIALATTSLKKTSLEFQFASGARAQDFTGTIPPISILI